MHQAAKKGSLHNEQVYLFLAQARNEITAMHGCFRRKAGYRVSIIRRRHRDAINRYRGSAQGIFDLLARGGHACVGQ